MRKFLPLVVLFLAGQCWADESWLGLYMQGNKIGYSYSSLTDTTLNNAPAKKSESSMVMNTSLLGQAMSMRVDSSSWLDAKGKPILMKFTVSSAGRVQKVDAVFTSSQVQFMIDNSGAKTVKTVPLPTDAEVVDDAVGAVLENGYASGKTEHFYSVEPMTATLQKCTVKTEGKVTTQVWGKAVQANKIEVDDPQTTSYVYLTSKGDLVKVEGPLGIEMLPETKKEALKEAKPANTDTDLAFSTSLTPDKPIPDIESLTSLKLRITGHELSALPSDHHQSVEQKGGSWIIDLHPDEFSDIPEPIAAAAAQKAEWVKPAFNLPSDSARFKDLATQLTAGTTSVQEAAHRIQQYVHKTMVPNAGIGVLRDASEILRTKEGVCRDYAVLTATLLRAAHVPAQLVSGLVYEQGSFFYHAWVEVWDGHRWIGVDSTLPNGKVTAGHIKLAEGNVEQAFTFTFLDRVKVEVLDAGTARGS